MAKKSTMVGNESAFALMSSHLMRLWKFIVFYTLVNIYVGNAFYSNDITVLFVVANRMYYMRAGIKIGKRAN